MLMLDDAFKKCVRILYEHSKLLQRARPKFVNIESTIFNIFNFKKIQILLIFTNCFGSIWIHSLK